MAFKIALRTFDDTPRNGRAGIPIDNCPYRALSGMIQQHA